jgi:hypothetical protein
MRISFNVLRRGSLGHRALSRFKQDKEQGGQRYGDDTGWFILRDLLSFEPWVGLHRQEIELVRTMLVDILQIS